MSNPEVECLVRDARELMLHISKEEQNLEDVIRRSNAVRAKIDCMKEYQDAVDAFNNATSNGKTREILLRDLQKETRLIQRYVKENLELKEINEELLIGLNSIMYRHRSLMEQMMRPENKVDQDVLPQIFEKSQVEEEKKYHLEERNMHYYRLLTNCLDKCEQEAIENAEVMASLREENAGLRQLLKLHKLNEPSVMNVYNQIRQEYSKRKLQEREEMEENVLVERTWEDDNKKISVIERYPGEFNFTEKLPPPVNEEDAIEADDMNNTILRVSSAYSSVQSGIW